MAWNEPGRGKDPWGGKSGRGSDGPPDLDQLIRDLQRRFRSLFGGQGSSGNGGSGSAISTIVIVILLGWAMTGVYQVDQAERGVVLHFGQYKETVTAGLHWHLPWPIESHLIENVDRVRSYPHRTEMLTSDENLVDLDITVQYVIDNVENYLFQVREADLTLEEVSQSAIREVVGKSTLEEVLSGEGRVKISDHTMKLIQTTLDGYKAGIRVTSVNLQQVQLPQQVIPAADDVNKAREDKQKVINEAQAYANDVVPRARGQAARNIQEANAYRDRIIAEAQGESQRFTKLLTEYHKAPSITRERLYLDTMEVVLGKVSKVLVDTNGNGNMIYLPVDKLLEMRANRDGNQDSDADNAPAAKPQNNDDSRNRSRSRQ